MSKVVCLKPGHNCKNKNRSPDSSYYEWKFNQDVCDKAEELFKAIPGIKCVKTKESDTYPTTLEGEVAKAEKAKADIYLSQHTNAYGSGWTEPNGFTVHYYPGREKSKKLAQIGLKWSEKLLSMNSRGVRTADLYEVRVPSMPAIIFETGFHTNREDVAKLKTQEFRWLAAEVLVRTACEFLGVDFEMSEEKGKEDGVLYRVQVGAFKHRENADRLVAKLKKDGYDTYLVESDGLYKVQTGAFAEQANASALARKLKDAGYDVYITTKSGQPAAPAKPAPKPVIKVGSKVKVKKGAKTYTGGSLSSFVYNTVYDVLQINGNRVVIGLKGQVTAAVRLEDLILQ